MSILSKESFSAEKSFVLVLLTLVVVAGWFALDFVSAPLVSSPSAIPLLSSLVMFLALLRIVREEAVPVTPLSALNLRALLMLGALTTVFVLLLPMTLL